MADILRVPAVPPSPPLSQPTAASAALVGAVNVSTGSADAGKIILTNPSGQLDASFGGGGGGGTVSVNGFSVSNPNFVDSASLTWTVLGSDISATVAGISTSSSGTNSTAAMVVGTGASIAVSGTGSVEATQIQAVAVSAAAPTTGQVLTA